MNKTKIIVDGYLINLNNVTYITSIISNKINHIHYFEINFINNKLLKIKRSAYDIGYDSGHYCNDENCLEYSNLAYKQLEAMLDELKQLWSDFQNSEYKTISFPITDEQK